MIALKRDLQIDAYQMDDILFVCTELYAISCMYSISQRQLMSTIDKETTAEMLELACVEHCLPFEQAIEERVKGSFPQLEKIQYPCPFHVAWNCSGIYARLIAMLWLETKIAVVDLFERVYCSPLGDWLVDTSTAWPIVPSNMLLDESYDILGLKRTKILFS